HLQHPYGRALLAAAELTPKRGTPQREAASPVLQVRDIVHEYSRRRRSLWRAAAPMRAVDGVSLCIHAGETVGLVGESGSGKSSLLRVVLALERPQAGGVRLFGGVFSHAKGAEPASPSPRNSGGVSRSLRQFRSTMVRGAAGRRAVLLAGLAACRR